MLETALGRLVGPHEVQTVLEDAILKLLYDYRMNPQNPSNVPMKLSDIVRGVQVNEQALVIAALDALKEQQPSFVEERERFQQERTFRITGTGVRFVRNVPQGIFGVL